MDMDHRTRMLGGRAGRIILLGQHGSDDDGDIDMDERGEAEEEEDKDLEEQVKKGQANASENGPSTGTNSQRDQREGTPGPTSGKDNEPTDKVEEAKQQQATSSGDEPKMAAVADSEKK
ncbi:hypothetical protein K431DRAFT_288028 [Polychaeton citri CBS 116435]|uniref:Uncharacterized protein n=1 Tax=Polychaeton citri CBS 116435 TaxID=1314669 RepID=A0A9P4UL31_9PEZI|nr:hypothetical protein K431DRAFT_288028 [Polychaeton citri CBS 116435]